MKPFPEEFELTDFFKSEPILADAGVPWAYNRLKFIRKIGEDIVECEIAPGYETLKFRWIQKGTETINLDLNHVSGLEIQNSNGREVLHIHFQSRSRFLPLRIQFVPSIQVELRHDGSL